MDQRPAGLMRREQREASPELRPDKEARQETAPVSVAGAWPLLLVLPLLLLFPFLYDLVQWLLGRAAWR